MSNMHPHLVYGSHGYPDGNYTRSPTFNIRSLWDTSSEDFYFTVASITILCITVMLVCLCFCCLGKAKSVCRRLWYCCSRPVVAEEIEMKDRADRNNNYVRPQPGKEVPAALLDFVGLMEERYYKVLDELGPREARMGPLPSHFPRDDYVDRLLRRMCNRRHSAARREGLLDTQSIVESPHTVSYTPSGQLVANSSRYSYFSLPRTCYTQDNDGRVSIIGQHLATGPDYGGRAILVVPPSLPAEQREDTVTNDNSQAVSSTDLEVQAIVEAAPDDQSAEGDQVEAETEVGPVTNNQ